MTRENNEIRAGGLTIVMFLRIGCWLVYVYLSCKEKNKSSARFLGDGPGKRQKKKKRMIVVVVVMMLTDSVPVQFSLVRCCYLLWLLVVAAIAPCIRCSACGFLMFLDLSFIFISPLSSSCRVETVGFICCIFTLTLQGRWSWVGCCCRGHWRAV